MNNIKVGEDTLRLPPCKLSDGLINVHNSSIRNVLENFHVGSGLMDDISYEILSNTSELNYNNYVPVTYKDKHKSIIDNVVHTSMKNILEPFHVGSGLMDDISYEIMSDASQLNYKHYIPVTYKDKHKSIIDNVINTSIKNILQI